jgi:hypothetical protein
MVRHRIARLIRSYRKRTKKFLSIPGMIGYEERLNLYRLAAATAIDGHFIEFGALLGASTASILAGISCNRSTSSERHLHVVDCFRTPSGSGFAEAVTRLANSKSSGQFLKENDGWVDFRDVFIENVRGYRASSRLIVHAQLLGDFRWTHGAIAFVHLDLPKDWDQLRLVVEKIFHELALGSLVLFQDFVYHWSAELVGFVGILLEQGYFEAIDVVDTTLVVRTKKSFHGADVSKFTALMSDGEAVLKGIRDAIKITGHLLSTAQRAVIELSRLQYCYDPKAPESTLREIGNMLVESTGETGFGARVGEMLQSDFRLLRSFEISSDQSSV